MRNPRPEERHPLTVLGERVHEAERVLVATALYAPGAAARLVGSLAADDLRHERLRALWQAIERLERSGQPVTEIELIASGIDMALLEEVTGLEFDVAGAESPTHAWRAWKSASVAMRTFALLQAAESALARTAFTPKAVTEATIGLAPAIAALQLDLMVDRTQTTLLDALAEFVRSTQAGEARQVVGSWGLSVLDERLGSLRAGTSSIVCGFPGHGKSTLGLQAARATAARGGRVLYVTTEMLRHELAMRVLCAENTVSPRELEARIRGGDIGLRGHEVAERILPEDRQRSIDAIAALVRTERVSGRPFALVVLDYLQMLSGPGDNEYERLTYIAYRIKQIAVDESCACVAMAQVNRTAQANGPPSMRTLRGSSALEDSADAIVSQYRFDRTDATGSSYLLGLRIDKARNGEPGDVQGRVLMGAGTFDLWEPDRVPDAAYEAIDDRK